MAQSYESDVEITSATNPKGKGRKRARSSQHLQASSSAPKKAKSKAPIPPTIQSKKPLYHHVHNQEAALRMKTFESKELAAEKRVDQQTLAMFDILEVLSAMGHVEMALYIA